MLDAVLDGVYPRQRDIAGKFAWLRDGGGFYQSPSGLSSDFTTAEEIDVTGKPIIAGLDPDDWEQEHGGAIRFLNNFNPAVNTARTVRWNVGFEFHSTAGDTFDEFTFACVSGPHTFGAFAGIYRGLFNMFDGTNTPIQIEVGDIPESARFRTDNSADILTVTTEAPSALTVVWVFLQRPDGTKEIWQDGLLLGTSVHLMSPSIFGARLQYAAGFNLISKFSWAGPIGSGVFSTRAWTEDQVSEYTADPYGHHRELRQLASFPTPICLDASAGSQLVMDADVRTCDKRSSLRS